MKHVRFLNIQEADRIHTLHIDDNDYKIPHLPSLEIFTISNATIDHGYQYIPKAITNVQQIEIAAHSSLWDISTTISKLKYIKKIYLGFDNNDMSPDDKLKVLDHIIENSETISDFIDVGIDKKILCNSDYSTFMNVSVNTMFHLVKTLDKQFGSFSLYGDISTVPAKWVADLSMKIKEYNDEINCLQLFIDDYELTLWIEKNCNFRDDGSKIVFCC